MFINSILHVYRGKNKYILYDLASEQVATQWFLSLTAEFYSVLFFKYCYITKYE